MNNKIVSLPGCYLCTWLDSDRQNQWALVGKDSLEVLHAGTIGNPGVDNHCGATLCHSRDAIHAMIGGHHGPLEHHVFDENSAEWKQVGVAGQRATYPCAVSDTGDVIHTFYRCSSDDRWFLNYVRFEEGVWTEPVHLVVADKPGYVYWTNGAVAGPEGHVHLLFGNTRLLDSGCLLYSASHISTADRGATWLTTTGEALGSSQIQSGAIPLLDASPERIQDVDDILRFEAPGPNNYNYNQMNLSNPVIDPSGDLYVVFHNNRDGSADLWSRSENGWSIRPLTDVVVADSGGRIHPQSSLATNKDGSLCAGLMAEPTEECVWGPNGTYIVQATISKEGVSAEPVSGPESDSAHWLPAYAHASVGASDSDNAMLFTRGRNAGGFGNNANELETEVYLVAPMGN
jgi:hypothetical protein